MLHQNFDTRPPDSQTYFSKLRKHVPENVENFDGKSWFLEVFKIITDSLQDHFKDVYECPWSLIINIIWHSSSEFYIPKIMTKDDLTSAVTHFWPHFHQIRCAGAQGAEWHSHNKFCGAKHSPSEFPHILRGVQNGKSTSTSGWVP